VASGATGANLSFLTDGIISADLHGTANWTTVGFYLRVIQAADEVTLACRLGGFASLNSGAMYCRDIEANPVSTPLAGADHVYELDLNPAATGSILLANGRFAWLLLAAIAVLAVIMGVWIGRFAYSDNGAATQIVVPNAPPLEARQTDYWSISTAGVAVALVAWLAIRRLGNTPYEVNFEAALTGLGSIWQTTVPAALRLWLFWGLASVVTSGIMLQMDPGIDLLDALLAGASGVWLIAYFLGQLLGPVGLFSSLTIWMLLAIGIIQLARHPPKLRRPAPSPGQKLAIIAFLLLVVELLPLQFGSPVAPYMDVLSYPASVQRILSFGVYLPFDNDPYGCWGPRAQTPGLELFYAMLALASRVKLGVLAHSGAMLPMAAMLIFATYRLGLTLAGDMAGGIAALLLFECNIFRRLTGMRGTAAAFVLVAIALGFFLDRRRNRTLIAAGAFILGTAVAAHAIDGALAMVAAGLATLGWLAEGDYRRFAAAAGCLCGAMLIAIPEIAIGLGRPITYPLLPLSQVAGFGIILISVRYLEAPAFQLRRPLRLLAPALVPAFFMLIMLSDALTHESPFVGIMHQLPLLTLLGMAGLVVWLIETDQPPQRKAAALLAAILSFGMIGKGLEMLASSPGSEAVRSGIADIGFKLAEYWTPYFLVFPAAIPFAALCDRKPHYRTAIVVAFLTMLIYPWSPRFDTDYNYSEHSISEEWGIGMGIAAGGFWSGTHDSRWTMDSDDFALVRFLDREKANGRITTATHILHIAHDAKVMGDFNRFSVFTGIDDDPILYEIPGSDIGWMATSRVRPIAELGIALAQHPAYILEQVNPPPGMKNPPNGYEEVFRRNTLRLFRRKTTK
jgi:hypothetical protein